ncbi:Rrg9p [Saccharomyces cerevisiae YJM1419]|nr:Rrg9p [Saccharomyces cerevisiae YJM451]AJT13963.1 Rrg9p [Saccharomyces cerevisiae YJM1083]AJT16196.1 Rrg9p [Saccharomyces cerevisiae YJM1208]AJT28056.1 Rrg9p [Saccharomyces cerevisiae YJM1419]AJT34694.1 Rrg9p [Saccharomyces cerevisiae YJM1615]
MNILRIACRSFHCLRCGPLLNENRGWSSKKIIKLVNKSSLSNKEFTEKVRDGTKDIPEWKKQKMAVRKKLQGQRWNPPKKISQEQMEALRLLKFNFPELTASDLADRFKISPEAVRRILKSNWKRTDEENNNTYERWKRRGERIKEMYQRKEDADFVSNQIVTSRKIVLGSNSNSPELIARNVRTFKHFKPNNSTPEKKNTNKLYILKHLGSKQ